MSNTKDTPMDTAPFYVGETVIAVDAMPEAVIKNGKTYRVVWCDKYYCKGSYYWGVRVDAYPTWTLAPRLFASMAKGKMMTFEKVGEKILGKILCALGLHKETYVAKWRGFNRPHFECKRKGCNYWME